jgi:hypothetical protein
MKMLKSVAVFIALFVAIGLGGNPPYARSTGIALDSEYLVFIVDTSGSMRRYEWDRVGELIESTLDGHPSVAGIQVLNDEGRHLFLSYTGEWMPNTPAMRTEIAARLEEWDAFSNSSPRNGIHTAIDLYADPDKNISLYVLGDDFSSGSAAVESLIREIDEHNLDQAGNLRVRINAVAFPIYFDVTGNMGTGGDYADLMLALTQHNGGSFIALPGRASGPNETREPITGLRTGLDRTLILIDASVFMAGARWQQVVATVEDLAASLAAGSQVQVVVLGSEPRVLTGDAASPWIRAADEVALNSMLGSLQTLTPAGESSLDSALAVIDSAVSGRDNVWLLTSGLPTVSRLTGEAAGTDDERYALFQQAARGFPPRNPINVLLLGSDDRRTAEAFWWLSLSSGGSMVAVASDWP